jgi:predicted nucleic-acid-binding protein
MIGIDTNIVLRYLLKDDPVLSPRALDIIAASSHGLVHVETFDRDFARIARKLRTAPPVQYAVK